MKKVLTVLLAMLMVSCLAACGNKADNATETTGDHKIAVIVFQEDMFMQMLEQGVEKCAKERGWTCLKANSEDDAAKLQELVTTYTQQGVECIVAQYTQEEIANEIFKNAHDAGLYIASGAKIEDLSLLDGTYETSLASSQAELGAGSGRAAVQYCQEKGLTEVNLGVVEFVSQGAWYSKQRSDNFIKALTDAGIKVNVVADQDAWVTDAAVTVTTDILTAHPEINMIYGANDGGTVGSTMAVAQLGLQDQVACFGCDATEQILTLMLDDENYSLVATSGQDATTLGYESAKALIDKVEGIANDNLGKYVEKEALPLNDFNKEAAKAYLEEIKAFAA